LTKVTFDSTSANGSAKVRFLGAHSTNKRSKMSKKSKKSVVFSLTMPKSEVTFATLATPLKAFGKLRQDFESLGLRVELVDVK
jgi:hypothetical protein